MLRRILLCVIAAPFFSGCASSGPKFKEAPPADVGGSRLYIYRPWALPRHGATLSVRVDAVQVGFMDTDTYLSIDVKPGKHKIETFIYGIFNRDNPPPQAMIELETQPGNSHFLRFDYFATSIDVYHVGIDSKLTEVEESIAKSEISKLSLSTK